MSETPLLFLDMDGVLNSAAFFKVSSKRQYRRARGRGKAQARLGLARWVDQIDPVAVERLNEIVRRATPDIVVSSSWRKAFTLEEIAAVLGARGFVGQLRGATPSLGDVERGEEIAVWLLDRPAGYRRFAILDDADDMGALSGHLVQTSFERGLENQHVEQVLVLLAPGR